MARQIGKMLHAREPKIIHGPEILDKYVGQSEANVRWVWHIMGVVKGLYSMLLYIFIIGNCLLMQKLKRRKWELTVLYILLYLMK